MLSLILAATLAQSSTIRVEPNIFEPKEVSTAYLFISMQFCFQEKGGFSMDMIPECGCRIDAVRFNTKLGKANTSPTPEQLKRCEAALKPKPPPPPPKPSKGKGGV